MRYGRDNRLNTVDDLHDLLLCADALPGRQRKEYLCNSQMGWDVNRLSPYILCVFGFDVGVLAFKRIFCNLFYGTL